MTMIANPNWFSVVSAAFLLGGLCLAVKAALADPAPRDEAARRKIAAERKVDLSLGLPLLILGGILNVLASVSTLSFNWVATSLLLGFAYTLLIYLLYYDNAVDKIAADQTAVTPRAPKLAVVASAAPALPQPDASEARPLLAAAPKEAAAQS